MSDITAIIPARGGSKGIKKKIFRHLVVVRYCQRQLKKQGKVDLLVG